MERESFTDEEVAKLLNQFYVAIKVDREERPDVDHLYMTVCQLMTGQGGWPLTIFAAPGLEPFFAGTYFPKSDKWGRPGITSLLQQIADMWQKDRGKIHQIKHQVLRVVEAQANSHSSGDLSEGLLDGAYARFAKKFDSVYGGFGTAPKFPMPHQLLFLLRYADRRGEANALDMAEKTLEAMYRGGIYDHLGFGFARYATDRGWLVPHFEKMLYDNALLAYTYLEAYEATGKRFYAEAAKEICTYVSRVMTSPEGGFYSAEDADSEGEEGRFYLWSPEGIAEVLDQDLARRAREAYNVTRAGNFEGKSILHRAARNQELGISVEDLLRDEGLELAREQMFSAREQRVHPLKDDKILTAWNGLMIAALAKGARVLGENKLAEAAENALHFISAHLTRNGRLLARYREGEAAFLAYASDYAYLIWGLIELYQATWKPEYLQQALDWHEKMTSLFWDSQSGGFYFYGSDSEQLLVRPKEIYDGALPSENSVAALNALRLAHLSGDMALEEQARGILSAFAGEVGEHPEAHAFYLLAADFALGPVQEIVIGLPSGRNTGPAIPWSSSLAPGKPVQDGDRDGMLAVLQAAYLPRSVLSGYRDESEHLTLARVAPPVMEKQLVMGQAAVYVCQDAACQLPATSPEQLKQLVQKESRF